MDKETLIELLPPYRDEWVLVNPDQDVKDIIRDILTRHEQFSPYYDNIALCFDRDTIDEICNDLYDFCKDNIQYKEESDKRQTTSIPTGILIRGVGDCKHYASFIGGILDGINRLTGKRINWCYRFASYDAFNNTPYHVFIVVNNKGKEIWIDPTPGANEKTPSWIIDKKVKPSKMALYSNIGHIGGLYSDNYVMTDELYSELSRTGDIIDTSIVPDLAPDSELSADVLNAIQLLLQYGIADEEGNIYENVLFGLQTSIDPDTYGKLMDALTLLDKKASIAGLFQTIFRGFKKVTLALPRGAYLSMVALNVFGLGSKLAQATSTTDGANKVRNKWYALGGDWAKLRQAISNGQKRKRILGAGVGVVQAAVPAWVLTASAIIAALAPIISEILKAQKASNAATVEGYDYNMGVTGDSTAPPAGSGSGSSGSSTDFISMIKAHPLESAAIAVVGFLLLKKFNVIE